MSDKPKIRYRCPVCQKRVATYIPRGGDGSGIFFKRHKDRSEEKDCKGWGVEATADHEEVVPLAQRSKES